MLTNRGQDLLARILQWLKSNKKKRKLNRSLFQLLQRYKKLRLRSRLKMLLCLKLRRRTEHTRRIPLIRIVPEAGVETSIAAVDITEALAAIDILTVIAITLPEALAEEIQRGTQRKRARRNTEKIPRKIVRKIQRKITKRSTEMIAVLAKKSLQQ